MPCIQCLVNVTNVYCSIFDLFQLTSENAQEYSKTYVHIQKRSDNKAKHILNYKRGEEEKVCQ